MAKRRRDRRGKRGRDGGKLRGEGLMRETDKDRKERRIKEKCQREQI